jgi:hypothetical protein
LPSLAEKGRNLSITAEHNDTTGIGMNSFIRPTEVRLPSPDRTALVLGGGIYGNLCELVTLCALMRLFPDAAPGKWDTVPPRD